MNEWGDFNNAEEQKEFGIIPSNTIAIVQITIRPGGYDTQAQFGIEGQAATMAANGAVYLDCELAILGGKYDRRRLWHKLGLYSPKGPEWGNAGRAFIRALLNSSSGHNPADQSPAAQVARTIQRFEDIEAKPFIIRIGIEHDKQYSPKNRINKVIEPNDPAWAAAWPQQGA